MIFERTGENPDHLPKVVPVYKSAGHYRWTYMSLLNLEEDYKILNTKPFVLDNVTIFNKTEKEKTFTFRCNYKLGNLTIQFSL